MSEWAWLRGVQAHGSGEGGEGGGRGRGGGGGYSQWMSECVLGEGCDCLLVNVCLLVYILCLYVVCMLC